MTLHELESVCNIIRYVVYVVRLYAWFRSRTLIFVNFFLEIFLCFRKKHYLCIRFQGRTFREPTRSDLWGDLHKETESSTRASAPSCPSMGLDGVEGTNKETNRQYVIVSRDRLSNPHETASGQTDYFRSHHSACWDCEDNIFTMESLILAQDER